MSVWGSRARDAAPLFVGSIAVAVGVMLFGSGGGDDSHITWWAVDELARTGHILNLNGAAMEQSSSLALVLIGAFLHRVWPMPTPQLGVLLSLAAIVGTCWMTARLARRLDPRLGLLAALLVASSGPLVYWGTSGMETALAAFAGVWLLDALAAAFELPARAHVGERATVRLAARLFAASALYASVRPENPLILLLTLAGAAALCFILVRRSSTGEVTLPVALLAQLAVLACAPVVLLFLFRHAAFHEWFPHPVAAKAGGGARWGPGFSYFVRHSLDFQPAILVLLPFSCIASGVLFWLGRVKLLSAVLALHAAAGALFVCSSGGDWMSCGRFLAPQLPVWWVVVLGCAASLLKARLKWICAGVAVLTALDVSSLVAMSHGGGSNGYPLRAALKVVPRARERYGLQRYSFLELANKSHLRDALLSEELERVVTQVQTLVPGKIWLASGQAGAVPYHVFGAFPGKLRFIDFWGLTSSEVRPCLPAARLKHSSLGIAMTPELLYQYKDRVLRDCGVPMADIVFNTSLRASTRRGLEQRGYRVVYFQRGAMPSFAESKARGGTAIDAYIAVREELAERLQLHYREVLWDIAG